MSEAGAGVLRRVETPRGQPHAPTDGSADPAGPGADSRALRVNCEWILFLYHSPNCPSGDICKYGEGCHVGRALWAHILFCADPSCGFRNCVKARALLWHFWHCVQPACGLCSPVRRRLLRRIE